MASKLKQLGKVTIKVSDTQVNSMSGATLDLGGTARTTQVGSAKVLGFTEAPKQARVEFSVAVRQGFDPQSLHVDDATIVFAGDTGQVWTLANAWSLETPVIDASTGAAKYTFEAVEAVAVV